MAEYIPGFSKANQRFGPCLCCGTDDYDCITREGQECCSGCNHMSILAYKKATDAQA